MDESKKNVVPHWGKIRVKVFDSLKTWKKKNEGEGLPFWMNLYKEAESFPVLKNEMGCWGEIYGITHNIKNSF